VKPGHHSLRNRRRRAIASGIEIISAVLLLTPRLIPVGAVLLVCTMIGAAVTHLAIIGGSPVPPLVLGVLAAASIKISLPARTTVAHRQYSLVDYSKVEYKLACLMGKSIHSAQYSVLLEACHAG